MEEEEEDETDADTAADVDDDDVGVVAALEGLRRNVVWIWIFILISSRHLQTCCSCGFGSFFLSLKRLKENPSRMDGSSFQRRRGRNDKEHSACHDEPRTGEQEHPALHLHRRYDTVPVVLACRRYVCRRSTAKPAADGRRERASENGFHFFEKPTAGVSLDTSNRS
jgi:hypothetical protein